MNVSLAPAPAPQVRVRPRVATFIFLVGAPGSGRKSLARYLSQLDTGIAVCNHDTPLWASIDNMMAFDSEPLDFEDPEVLSSYVPWSGPNMPERRRTYAEAIDDLYEHTTKTFGPEALGTQALFAANSLLQECESVVFPSVRTWYDVAPLASAAGFANCQIISLVRPGTRSLMGIDIPSDIPRASIWNDGTLDDLYERGVQVVTNSFDGAPANG